MTNFKKVMRILGGYITHLSLCSAGANNIQTIYKSDDGKEQEVTITTATKEMTEQGEIYSAVYVPEQTDLQGDIASAETIKQLAYSFSKIGKGIDIKHNEKVMPREAVFVAESFIIQKGDTRFDGMSDYEGNPVDVSGGWGVVIKVEDKNLKELYRSGEWQGISMGGVTAKRPEKTTLESAVKKLNKSIVEDTKMTKEEMMALLAENNKSLATTLAPVIAESIAKAIKPPEEDPKKKKDEVSEVQKSFLASYPMPVMPANPNDDTIAHFEKCAQVYELAKATNAEAVSEIVEFHKARKAIMEGKEVTIAKSLSADPWGFQRTNQTAGTDETRKSSEIISLSASAGDQLTGDEVTKILKMVPTFKEGKQKVAKEA